jgi:hypothetical protein
MHYNKFLIVFIIFLFPMICQSKLYKWVDEDGNIHFTNVAPPQEYADEAESRGETKSRPSIRRMGNDNQGEKTNGNINQQKDNLDTGGDNSIYRQAEESIRDIYILLQSSGVTYRRYNGMISDASLAVGRLPNTKRADDLQYIADWYSIAGKCWHNSIFNKKKRFPYDQADDISRIRTHFKKDVDSFAECRHVIWNRVNNLFDDYQREY